MTIKTSFVQQYSRNNNRQQWLRAMREEGKVVYKPWLEQ